MEDCGRLWKATEGCGRPWRAVEDHGRLWKTMEGLGRLVSHRGCDPGKPPYTGAALEVSLASSHWHLCLSVTKVGKDNDPML